MAAGNLIKQSQASVRRNNLRLVLDAILRSEPLSRADLMRLTHISKPTVSVLIDELIGRGIVGEAGFGQSRSGRKPILLQFNSRARHLLAFEMGRVGCRIALADLKGRFIRKRTDEFEKSADFALRVERVKRSIVELLEEAGVPLSSILKAICIAPGIYVEQGQALEWTAGYSHQRGRDLRDSFRGFFGREIELDHSTKLALLGEKIAGQARDLQNVLYIDFAYGLGCSLLIDGRLYFGPQNTAGEIGYFYSSPEEFQSFQLRPYEMGALETRISGRALQEQAARAVGSNPESSILRLAGGDPRQITARTVFAAARQGDTLADSLLREAFGYFNPALSNIINLLTPEAVIFGGGFSHAEDLLLQYITEKIRDKVLIMPRLLISKLKNDASLIGAVHYLIERTDFLDEL